jgi:hypothetical protein
MSAVNTTDAPAPAEMFRKLPPPPQRSEGSTIDPCHTSGSLWLSAGNLLPLLAGMRTE